MKTSKLENTLQSPGMCDKEEPWDQEEQETLTLFENLCE